MKKIFNTIFCIFVLCLSGSCFAASLNLTTIPTAAQIIDSSGGVWTVDGGGRCYLNGVQASGCGGNNAVVTLLWYNAHIYVHVANGNWWLWNGGTWGLVEGDPRPQPSASGATIPSATQIVDSNYGVWTVDSSGRCYLNGVQASGCGGASPIKTLLWYQGFIYVAATDGTWWLWNGGSWGPVAQDARPQPSASGTTIPAATKIVDSNYGLWTVDSSGRCYLNGVQASGCGGVSQIKTLLWYQGSIYADATNGSWWKWSGSNWGQVGTDPRPQPSASGATIPPATQIVDSNYGVWTVDSSGRCYLNGVQASGCSNVKTLLWYNGQMYVAATNGNWWLWNGSSWGLVPQTSTPLFNPASLGYSLVFNGTFGNPGDIDLANTSAPGFKWYFCRANQSATPVPASDFSVASNGVLTITPTVGEPNNAQLCSAIPVKTPPLWVGNAFSGGWYIEYSIAFDNTTLNLPSGAQWPAVWAMPVEKIIAGANTTLPPTGIQWPGQASGFAHFIENDMFEYNTGITNGWDATVIDWQGVFGVFDSYLKCAGFCGVQNQNHFITLPSVKWTSFNTFGQLWIPGTAANNYQGSVTNYFNGIKVSSGVTWTSQGVGTPGMITNPPTGTFTWSAMDGLTYYIILGTGHTTPLQVQWVHVWQKP